MKQRAFNISEKLYKDQLAILGSDPSQAFLI